MATVQDDRTAEQRLSHCWLVVARDRFMSGWGGASGGASIAAWACRTRLEADACGQWVRNRREMRNVRLVLESKGYVNRIRGAHVHVYVVNDGHPAIRGVEVQS